MSPKLLNVENAIPFSLLKTLRIGSNVFVRLIRLILLIGLSFLALYPVFSMISLAFRPATEMYDETVVWIAKNPTLLNFKEAFKKLNYVSNFLKTAGISGISSLLTIFSCSLAAYGLSRFNFKGKNLAFILVVLTIVVPPQTAQVPTFVNYCYFDFFGIGKIIGLFTGKAFSVNILNTYWVMILPAAFAAGLQAGLYIFVFRQFFLNMPKGLEEAARIDGCNAWQTYWRIIVPNGVPVFVVVFLLSMVAYWNDTAVTGIYLMDSESYLMMHNLKSIVSNMLSNNQFGSGEVLSNAMAILAIAPIVILFIVCQHFFTEFLDNSGVKG